MLNQSEIDGLISEPKRIARANPTYGMKTDGRNEKKNLDLVSADGKHQFDVFIRKNLSLIEDFSVGLIYKSNQKELGDVMLIRFNGSHGQRDWSENRHYSAFHIHAITEDLLREGIRELKNIKMTDRFTSSEQALAEFFSDISVENWQAHFPELKQLLLSNVTEGSNSS